MSRAEGWAREAWIKKVWEFGPIGQLGPIRLERREKVNSTIESETENINLLGLAVHALLRLTIVDREEVEASVDGKKERFRREDIDKTKCMVSSRWGAMKTYYQWIPPNGFVK